MRSSGRYVIGFAMLGWAQVAVAFPRSDLLCTPVEKSSLGATPMKLRLDFDGDAWCADECLLTSRFAQRGEAIWKLIDGQPSGDAIFTKRLTYHPVNRTLMNETTFAGGSKTSIKYACVDRPFSGFASDRSKEPMLLPPYPGRADYPPAAKRDHIGGQVMVRLQVDAAGKPVSCDISKSSGSEELDHATCRFLMTRGRLSPARDPQGKPIAAAIDRTVNWVP